jgi:hypothetical protein
MRRIRKLSGTDKRIPIIKEERAGNIIRSKVINKNVTKVTVNPNNIPIVTRNEARVNMESQHNKNMYNGKVDPIWSGETVYIIGGGPSLAGFNWKGLEGKKTIAINKALITYPNADVVYWTDSRVYRWYTQEINRFKGLKYTIKGNAGYAPDVKVLKRGVKFGLEEARDRLAHGNNSGYAAINLAYLLGAKRIILLGYDMKNDGIKGHYHDGYPVPMTSDKIYRDQFLPGFEILAEKLKEKKVQVYNASPISNIKCFPKINYEKALTFR